MALDRRVFLGLTLAGMAAPHALADGQQGIRLRDFYNKDMSYSDIALELAGTSVTIEGFMAPPLQAESNFFVLTNRPLAICPFCDTEADWPNDIAAIYTKRSVVIEPFNVLLAVTGVLDLESYRDPDTGFLSRLRLIDARYEKIG
jgi:hypothetical protein